MNKVKGILGATRALSIPFSIFNEVIKMIKLYEKEQLEEVKQKYSKEIIQTFMMNGNSKEEVIKELSQ